jgi:hypothetical protein
MGLRWSAHLGEAIRLFLEELGHGRVRRVELRERRPQCETGEGLSGRCGSLRRGGARGGLDLKKCVSRMRKPAQRCCGGCASFDESLCARSMMDMESAAFNGSFKKNTCTLPSYRGVRCHNKSSQSSARFNKNHNESTTW